MGLSSIRWTRTPGPAIRFMCPRCNKTTGGESFTRRDQFYLLHFIPLFATNNTYVTCSTCKMALLSSLSAQELAQHKGMDVTNYLRPAYSLVTTVVVIAGFLLFMIPIFGLVMPVIATIATWKHPGGWRKALARVSVGLAIAANIFFACIGVFSGSPAGRR